MSAFEIGFTALVIILGVIMCGYYIKSKKGFSKLIIGVGSGLASLYIASLVMPSFGFALPINLITGVVSGILGVPGTLLLISLLLF